MGTFSWLTADTNESLLIGGNGKPAYLLQPDGRAPIEESCYMGYGDWGHEDLNVYKWLALENMPKAWIADRPTEDELYNVGVGLEHGNVYLDERNSRWFTVFHSHEWVRTFIQPVTHFEGRYDEIVPEYGLTPNQLITGKQWLPVAIQSMRILGQPFKPLKFSFDPNAVYENLPASSICPNQGHQD